MIYINDKFIEMYAEMTKKFYDSINEENEKQKDMIEFINYLKELIERNHSLEKENQQLKEQLEASEKARKEAIDYINFLVIIDTQLAGGRFKDTIWGKELLEILDIDKGE